MTTNHDPDTCRVIGCPECGEWLREYDERARGREGHGAGIAGIVVAVLLALGLWHEAGVLASRDSPPAACQEFGGQWGIFTGWHCGSLFAPVVPAQDPPPADNCTDPSVANCVPGNKAPMP